MKDKVIRLFGLFMTIALIAGLAGVSAMSAGGSCSAATSSLKWTPLSIPDGTHKQLYPGSDVGPMAVTSDGGTLFAAVNVSGNWSMLKSTDGGYTWRSTGFPTDATDIVAVKLSPSWSSDGTIYVATNNSVYKSKDRGNTFTNLSMSGVSGTITSLDAGVGADGKVKLVLGTSAEVYLFDDGVWTAQNIGGYDVLAVAFSPSYATDGTIVAVVNTSSQTVVKTKYGTNSWGSKLADEPINVPDSYKACIGMPSDYNILSSNPSLFVGLSAASNGGDVFSIDWGSSVPVTDLNVSANGSASSVNIWSMAVSGDYLSAVIVAGAETPKTTKPNESILVFAGTKDNNNWNWVLGSTVVTPNKQPTGESHATVVKAGSVAYVGTQGNQSAVSVDATGAYTSWNQRGLIDTSIDTVTDMVVSADYFSDSTMYITTNGSAAASLWVTQTGGASWERIFCSTLTKNSTTCMFDMVRVSTGVVVLAESGSNKMWLSTDGGTTFSNKINAMFIGPQENITAFALGNDGSTLYAGGADGSVSWSTDYGMVWTNASSDSEIPSSDTVMDIVLAGNDTIYVSTDSGGVYSAPISDLSFIPVGSDAPGVAGDIVKVAPDPYEEDYLYAGITGRAGTRGIWRCYLGDPEAEWEQIADGATVGNISSLACAEDNGILYAISSTDGIGYRCVRPTSTKEAPVFESFGAGLDTGEKVKSGLKVISGSNLLFAIGGAGGAYNKIWTSSDEIIKMRLLAPTNGAIAGDVWENGSHAGKALVALSWEQVTSADSYEVQIAPDADFITVLNSSCFASGSPYTANQMISANLWLGSEYYWRVRVVAPYQSQWSDNWSFTTPLGPKASLPELLSPAAGQSNVPLRPVLQWNNSLAATSYELVLTENCNSSNTVLNLVGDKKLGAVTAYQVPFDLKPGTSYCWKVRGLSDVTGSQWSDTGTFTTMAAPVVAKESGTPAWVWIIIALSAVLIGAVVVLVVRTRRPI
jgi:hypothetical protein